MSEDDNDKTVEGMHLVFANNLKRLRAHAKQRGNKELSTPFGLERQAGVGNDSITRYEKMTRPIDIVALTKLARVYNLHPWEMLYPGLDPTAPPAARIDRLLGLFADHLKATRETLERLEREMALVRGQELGDSAGKGRGLGDGRSSGAR